MWVKKGRNDSDYLQFSQNQLLCSLPGSSSFLSLWGPLSPSLSPPRADSGPPSGLHFSGFDIIFSTLRLLPAASANFPQLQPLPHNRRPETTWGGEDPPPPPSPRLELGWGNKCHQCPAGKIGGLKTQDMAYLSKLRSFLPLCSWWPRPVGRQLVGGRGVRPQGHDGPNHLRLVLLSKQ